ncbi:MAG: anthranilate synthase component I [Chloroflexota bacterium]|nr:anthranilate synthase component I [Chloroflexota bacterium]
MDTPDRQQFEVLAERGNLIPIYRELAADLETPVSVFLKLRGEGAAFLLESVEKGEQQGRYSILGFDPERQIIARGRAVEVRDNGRSYRRALEAREDALTVVEAELARFTPVEVPGIPRFHGGAVGYIGYDLVAAFEPVLAFKRDEQALLPDLHLLLTDTILIFDHVKHRLLVIANAHVEEGESVEAAYEAATSKIDSIAERLQRPLPPLPPSPDTPGGDFVPSVSRKRFEENVRAAKEYIAAGDIFQVVLSQRLARRSGAEPFAIYRTLRRVNPSPYMFFFDLSSTDGGERLVLIGASPEMLVRLEGGTATVRPIAGTRPRGATRQEDERLETELHGDPKERAEHVMLVDLGRNDLGRVCEYGTVQVADFIITERYSHVMHLVSEVNGQLRADRSPYDLLRATFPAGTVSGAPKIRAMQIIEELEGLPRGPYAGAVGYFGYNGNIDTCITIRTIWMRDDIAHIQAGAGIVADSDPTTEWHETLHKARALGVAIDMAERGI